MKQEVCLLPVRCKGCSRVFDLWQVLQEEEASGVILSGTRFSKALSQSFCPSCRRAVLLGLNEPEVEEETGDEYQMTLELE